MLARFGQTKAAETWAGPRLRSLRLATNRSGGNASSCTEVAKACPCGIACRSCPLNEGHLAKNRRQAWTTTESELLR